MPAPSLSMPGIHPGKHVSFQEKIYTIETDGTVGCAVLKQAKALLERHASLPFDFDDFGHCRIADSAEEQENESPFEERLDVCSSYKKFAPRSQLAYVKRASM